MVVYKLFPTYATTTDCTELDWNMLIIAADRLSEEFVKWEPKVENAYLIPSPT